MIWLHLRFHAPLMAFGGVAIDQVGPTRDFPSTSAIVGLLANALGWRRAESEAHQALQDRLEFGAIIDHEGELVTDTQNAKLEKADQGWTTFGRPEGRAGATYSTPHRRRREFLADHDCHVVLRVTSGNGPDLDAIEAALHQPARPLFIGRKPCLPAGPILQGRLGAPTVYDALAATGATGRAQWPQRGEAGGKDLPDLRNWRSGLHGGNRRVTEGHIG